MTESILQIKDLKKSFGDNQILKGISLDVKQGEVVVILGSSGCGKSTLLRCINGLETIQGGDILLDGKSITGSKKDFHLIRQKIGMVFQHFNLYDNHTVLENITLAPKIVLHRPEKENHDIAMDLLKKVGLEEKANMYPRQLSGGQKQRITIARALLKNPKILILDDSTSAVDTKTDSLIRQGLASSLKDTTKIIIGQRISSIQDADRIIVMNDGRIDAIGTHDELVANNAIYREVYKMQTQGKGEADEN